MISLSRAAATAAIVIATVVTVVGCTKTDKTEPLPPAPSGSPSKPVSDVKLTPPEIQPGYRQVAADGPRRGAWDLGAVTLTKGVSWVNVNCVADSGTGKLVIAIDTVGEFTVDCPSTEARISVNQLDLAESRKGRFHIEADKRIRWSASLQVSK